MTDTPPPWELVRPVIEASIDLGQSPRAVSNLDQLQGWLTHRLEYLEVDVRDPHRLYEVFVILGVLYELAGHTAAGGLLRREDELAVKTSTITLLAALSRLLPEEVRHP